MNHSTKHKPVVITAVVYMALVLVFCTVAFFHPTARSESERRDLAQFPQDITWSGIVDKTVMDDFEDYSVDQFPFREFFRSLKARFQLNVLRLKENNSMATEDGYIAKIEQDFNPGLVDYSLGRLEYIYNKYLAGNGGKTFISLIPDKNYFFGKDYGYPAPDYDALAETVQNRLPNTTYIDIFDCLSLSDYYRTDTHWSQNRLGSVVSKLASQLGVSDLLSGRYTEHTLEGFKGVYYAQSALYPKPDDLVYLTNPILDACTVYDYENGKTYGIYNFDAFAGEDGYNFFLSGTRALLRIDNPNAASDRELIVFRDSFGSSLIPLLAEAYKSIYVVDIRYVAPDFLGSVIDFEGKDTLFLYSTLVLNQKAFK